MTGSADDLERLASAVPEVVVPPVHAWDPPTTRDIDMLIARNGDWFYQGSQIQRPRMIRLFSSVLRVDDDGHTYLVTPQERLRIRVADAPFVAVLVERHGAPGPDSLVFTLNTGDRVVADAQHQISVEYASEDGQPSPYILVRDRLRALISRSAFYHMADWAVERDGIIGVESSGLFMPLSSNAHA
ncbi:MAG: DUF1285 domain-containing protein [Granulosicoccus sp.]